MKKLIHLLIALSLTAQASDTITIDKQYYTIVYNKKMMGAERVTYVLERDKVNSANLKKRPKFYTEKKLPKKYQTHSSDYTNTGYDRGHLANDASFDWSKDSQKSTYSMANIIPQKPNANRRAWLAVEKMERYTATQFPQITVTNIVEYKNSRILKKKPLEQVLAKKKFKSAKKKYKFIKKYKKAAEYLAKKKIRIPTAFYKVLENKEYGFKECYKVKQTDSSAHDRLYLIDCSKVPRK